MFRKIVLAAFSLTPLFAFSQASNSAPTPAPFEHLSVSVGTGSMGLALEASTPIASWLDVRAGLSWMPQFRTKMAFGVQVGEEDKKYDKDGNRIKTKFEKMAAMLEEATGYEVDEAVNMDCKASFLNAKVMFDFKPFTNKDFRLTAGFYWGTKTIGRAINSYEDMSTTLAVGIYNTIYNKVADDEPVFDDFYLGDYYGDVILRYGKMGMPVGYFKSDGSLYLMEPDKDGAVRAWAKVNSFKPYLGFGWDHALKADPSWRLGLDAGVIFWGGVPNIYTHDGTSLTRDVNRLEGKVKDVISFAKSFPVYPLLEVRVSKTLF